MGSNSTSRVKPRPAIFRALGKSDPPAQVECEGLTFQRIHIYKHDSWAATAVYQHDQRKIVCKFNRRQPILLIPTFPLGWWLAAREAKMLDRLSHVDNVPALSGRVMIEGRRARNVAAHEFIVGEPLKIQPDLDDQFFDQMWQLLADVHAAGIAYVDLHKAENVLVDSDGQPHLIDFQVSVWLPKIWPLSRLLATLQQMDRYHFARHKLFRRPDLCDEAMQRLGEQRPWWIRLHRSFARPIREARRRLLVRLGIRRDSGKAHTELVPEEGQRKAA